MTWFAINVVVGGVVVLLLVVRSEGKVLEFLVIFLVHFPKLLGKASVDIVLEPFPFGFLSLASSFSNTI